VRRGTRALALAALLSASGAQARAQAVEVVHAVVEDAVPVPPRVEDRLRAIRERIQAAVEYPPLARLRRLEGVAQVRFAISADGRPREVAVAGSTGHAILDRAALAAVERAAPLPWVYGRLEVPVRFELSARR
jgi:TonB family protein